MSDQQLAAAAAATPAATSAASTATTPAAAVATSTATPTSQTDEPVFDVVVRLIGEVIGEEYLVGIEIGPDTTFSDDLEMESIEFVALAEALQVHYGEQVDFVAWIADMELDDLISMSVGRVAEFVERCVR